MELSKFVTDSLNAILNGVKTADTTAYKTLTPTGASEGVHGVEFDIGVVFQDGKINVMHTQVPGNVCSRIKFSVPILAKK